MKQFVWENRFFLLPQLVFILVSSFFFMTCTKTGIHILLNRFHSPGFDLFFKLITNLGNGLLYIPVLAYLLIRKINWAFAFLIAVIVSNLLLFTFKHVLFTDMYRPWKYFELYETYQLHIVEGVKLHSLNSFPSGHATTAFTIFIMLALLTKKNSVKLFLLFAALLSGYSRVYLSLHFLEDIVAGSVIGSGSVMLAVVLLKYFEKPWMKKPLLSLLQKTHNKLSAT